MIGNRDVLDEVVTACLDLVDARETVKTHLALRDKALVAAQREGVWPKTGQRSLAHAVMTRMRERGWSDEMIECAGVSPGSVRVTLDRARS